MQKGAPPQDVLHILRHGDLKYANPFHFTKAPDYRLLQEFYKHFMHINENEAGRIVEKARRGLG
ncbi:hypothetical protein LI291_06945 [Intestinibacillus massiliensis]|nr:hypothetical protein [Intestinibacillus massiliensis]